MLYKVNHKICLLLKVQWNTNQIYPYMFRQLLQFKSPVPLSKLLSNRILSRRTDYFPDGISSKLCGMLFPSMLSIRTVYYIYLYTEYRCFHIFLCLKLYFSSPLCRVYPFHVNFLLSHYSCYVLQPQISRSSFSLLLGGHHSKFW